MINYFSQFLVAQLYLIISLNKSFDPIYFRAILSMLATSIFLGLFINKYKKLENASYLFIGLILTANIEHVISNNSFISFDFAKFLTDQTFLSGSVFSTHSIFSFFVLAGIPFFISRVIKKFNEHKKYQVIIGLLSISLLYVIPVKSTKEPWLQKTFFEDKVTLIFTSEAELYPSPQSSQSLDEVLLEKELVPETLLGKKNKDKKYNVIIVFIEGLSRLHIDQGYMPKLKSLRKKYFSAEKFINTQRQTNRGLFSSLCGRYPNLIKKSTKSDFIILKELDIECLPSSLKKEGYETVFMQSARLSFMNKDELMKIVGFNEVIGASHYKKFTLMSKWGIDDKSLYLNALKKIDDLKDPFFLSLLTVGTHHPYEVPGTASSLENAFKYADDSIFYFYKALKNKGLLNDTILVITSDESNGSIFEHPLSDNFGSFILINNDFKGEKNEKNFFTQADIKSTVLDLVSSTKNTEEKGRSLIREYETSRKLFWGNTYKNITYFLEKDILTLYKGSHSDIEQYHFSGITKPLSEIRGASNRKYLKDVWDNIYSNDWDFFDGQSDEKVKIFSEDKKRYSGKYKYVVQEFLKLQLPKNKNVNNKILLSFDVDNKTSKRPGDLTVSFTVDAYDYPWGEKRHYLVKANTKKRYDISLDIPKKHEYILMNIYVDNTNESSWESGFELSVLSN